MKKLVICITLVTTALLLFVTASPASALTAQDCKDCHFAPDGTATGALVNFGVAPVVTPDKCVTCHDGSAAIHAGNPYVDTPYGKFLSTSLPAQPGWVPNPATIHEFHMGYTLGGTSFETYPTICGTSYCHMGKTDCEWCHGSLVSHQLKAHGNEAPGYVSGITPVTANVVSGKNTAPVQKDLYCLASACHAVIPGTKLQPNIRLTPSCFQSSCHGSESHEVVHQPDAALLADYATCGAAGCHVLNLVTEHLDNPALGCGTCHDSTDPAVVAAIAAGTGSGPQQGCFVCHGAGAGNHLPAHALTNPVQPPVSCQSASCHVDNLVTEHVDRRALTCDTCHNGSASVQQVIADFKDVAANPECVDCHAGASGHATQHELTNPVAPPVECRYCHTTNLLPVHIDPVFPVDVNESTWGAWDCDTCHSPTSRVASQVATFTANTVANPDCASCHTVTGTDGGHVDRHLTTSSACFDAGCHASTNLVTLHAGYGRTCDTCHTASPRSGVREAILANDTSCEGCHMAGHFDQHALPAGRTISSGYYKYSNRASGTTDCAICHTNNVILEHTGDATTGRPAWLATNGSPLDCDTCHKSTRTEVVEAIAAARTGQLTNCDQCHTVHGTPTLEHQSPSSAPGGGCGGDGCHEANLLIEHELRWSQVVTEVQNDTLPMNGVCERCHLGNTGSLSKTMVLTAIDNGDTTCQACHGPTAGVGHTAIHDPDAALSTTYASCAGTGCHVLNIATQHVGDPFKNGTVGSCGTCHASSAPQYAKDAIAAWKATGAKQGCFVCHGAQAGAHLNQHTLTDPVQPPVDCRSASCHVDNLVTEHVDRRALDCATCHNGPAAVQQVIANYRSGGPQAAMNPTCAECHGPTAGQHMQQHELVNPTVPECTSCHSGNLVAEHTVNNPFGCDTCHGSSASALVTSVISTYGGANPQNPVCTSCHSTYHGGAPAKHTADEGTDCKSCHLMMLPDEHARSTSISNSRSCSACHPLSASFVWTYKCADCHTTGGPAPAPHSAEAAKHASTQTDCAKSGCHAADLKSVHKLNCSLCHSTTTYPTTSDCKVCHGSGPHAMREPYKDSCDSSGCHSISGPGASLHDYHAVNRAFACTVCHSGVNPTPPQPPACATASCHEHPPSVIHSKSAHQAKPCTFCHKSGVPGHGPTPFKYGFTPEQFRTPCLSSGCHDYKSHMGNGDCKKCHGPGATRDVHVVESRHVADRNACGKCHDLSQNSMTDCRACHTFSLGWYDGWGRTTTTSTSTTTTSTTSSTTSTTSSTTTTSSSTTSSTTTSTTKPPATNTYKVTKAEYLQYLDNAGSDDRAGSRQDVTGRMGDDGFSDDYEIRRDRRMMSLRLDQSGSTVQTAVLRLYVNSLRDGRTQSIRVYRYASDDRSVSSSYSQYNVSSTGWIDLDVTGLVKATSGSWFKLRVTCGSDDYRISEARYVLTR